MESKGTAMTMLKRLQFIGAMLGMALLGACASNKYPPAPAEAATADYRYLIGPLDSVNIIVWRNPELSLTVPVRPDGRRFRPPWIRGSAGDRP